MFVCQDEKKGDCNQKAVESDYSSLFSTYPIVCGALDPVWGSSVK